MPHTKILRYFLIDIVLQCLRRICFHMLESKYILPEILKIIALFLNLIAYYVSPFPDPNIMVTYYYNA